MNDMQYLAIHLYGLYYFNLQCWSLPYLTFVRSISLFVCRYVPISQWPKEYYPAFCNGHIYAIRPQTAFYLTLVSRTTPLLPLDDVYVTGVLRDRLTQPKVGLKLINTFSMGTSFFEWISHCPFLGRVVLKVIYYLQGLI